MIHLDSGLSYVSSGLSTRKHLKRYLSEFSLNTSAHGVPLIRKSLTSGGKMFWFLICLTCIMAFSYQALLIVQKFRRREKVVDIQLRFENTVFPVVTICNLNPYKSSLMQEVSEVQRMLNVFDTKRNEPPKREKPIARVKRQDVKKASTEHRFIYKPVYARCICSEQSSECVPFLTAPEVKETLCICYYDIYTRTPWPCYSEVNWRSEWCSHCNSDGYCSAPITDQYNLSHTMSEPCICNEFTNQCLATRNETFESMWSDSLKPNEWHPYVTTPPITEPPTTTEAIMTTTEDPTYLEAIGFEGVTDDTAKASIAQENTVFIMANLSEEVKSRLSYGKHEFIQQCSFNGRQDFKIHIDPVFGNCYKFNADVTHKRSTSRAGPMYGLSLVVYVDVDDYLPTTKAAGVRVAVHPQEEYPFPDTFGYNAPTGLQSSFGIRLKKIERLPKPYGDCIREGKTEDYVYRDYVYTLEGCYRSCFQHVLIERCGCGDPRFPVPVGHSHCRVNDAIARSCLQNATRDVGGLHGHFTSRCVCQQPCIQLVYDMSFSAAQWPTPASQFKNCNQSREVCREIYSRNALSLEVYFEQLNYEVLKESEAYLWVNLMADFGGQLGLWMGVSVITCIEVLVLLWNILKLFCCQTLMCQKPSRITEDIKRPSKIGSAVELTLKIPQRDDEEKNSNGIRPRLYLG